MMPRVLAILLAAILAGMVACSSLLDRAITGAIEADMTDGNLSE